MIKGHCECRRVRFEVDGAVNDFSHCHCSQCRRLHGTAYATFAGVGRAGFRYIAGESETSTYESSPTHERIFCSTCGSNIMVKLTVEPDEYYLSMGAIEGSPELPAAYHIFVGSKAAWHEITDDHPQYHEEPPE
ncbi:MAG: GFA family protein [Gammaproteobacteria bacterium]|nr:GFA family protein [Gammaproteobacteria bacterium]